MCTVPSALLSSLKLPHSSLALLLLTLPLAACSEANFQASSDAGTEAAEAQPEADPLEHLPGGETTNTLLFGSGAFSRIAENIEVEHEGPFFSGNSFFSSAWVSAPASTTARDGLGPLFNARACAACHLNDGRGRPPFAEDEEVSGWLARIGTGERGEHGAAEGDPNYGDQLQPLSISDVPGEGKLRVSYREVAGQFDDGEEFSLQQPTYTISDWSAAAPQELRISPRTAPAMIGVGLLEAIPEQRLRELADPQDADGDGISGRVNEVWDVRRGQFAVGRFGWKAEAPTVEQQTAGAFLGDMGITSSLFPEQNCTGSQLECLLAMNGGEPEIEDDFLAKVTSYSSLLAVPMRERWRDPETLSGKAIFAELGCGGCHVAHHETADSAFAELSGQQIWPYTDLLLHDMGEALSDQRPSFDAEGEEWRTPPLWGVGRIEDVNGHNRLLHDGRARGTAEAILWHAGEAENASRAFRALDADERDLVVAFVESL